MQETRLLRFEPPADGFCRGGRPSEGSEEKPASRKKLRPVRLREPRSLDGDAELGWRGNSNMKKLLHSTLGQLTQIVRGVPVTRRADKILLTDRDRHHQLSKPGVLCIHFPHQIAAGRAP